MRTRNLLATLLLGCLTLLPGCGASYVNIPAQIGDVADHDPNKKEVLGAQEAAIRAAAEASGYESPYVFRVVSGTEERHYFAMAPRLGANASVDDIPGAPRLEVRQVYIRGWKAQVDLVRTPAAAEKQTLVSEPGVVLPPALPPSDDLRDLVTVYLKTDPIAGWYKREIKVWRIPVDKALATSARQSELSVEPE